MPKSEEVARRLLAEYGLDADALEQAAKDGETVIVVGLGPDVPPVAMLAPDADIAPRLLAGAVVSMSATLAEAGSGLVVTVDEEVAAERGLPLDTGRRAGKTALMMGRRTLAEALTGARRRGDLGPVVDYPSGSLLVSADQMADLRASMAPPPTVDPAWRLGLPEPALARPTRLRAAYPGDPVLDVLAAFLPPPRVRESDLLPLEHFRRQRAVLPEATRRQAVTELDTLVTRSQSPNVAAHLYAIRCVLESDTLTPGELMRIKPPKPPDSTRLYLAFRKADAPESPPICLDTGHVDITDKSERDRGHIERGMITYAKRSGLLVVYARQDRTRRLRQVADESAPLPANLRYSAPREE